MPYRFERDPLWWLACAGYAANRWLLRAVLTGGFFRGYFNDLLLIPAALPLVLELQRVLRLRTCRDAPSGREIIMHVVVWSVAAEGVGPWLWSRATGDLWDVVAYASGGIVAWGWWHRA